MRSIILIVIFNLTFSLFAKANRDCIWTSSKNGVTISFVAPCDPKYRLFIDSILNNILTELNRPDTTLQILVLVNSEKITYSVSHFTNFISIGFDTLRPIDDNFVFDYYWKKQGISMANNNGINNFESRLDPLDINSSYSKTLNQVGLKIIYNREYRLGGPIWSDIEKLISYASRNVEIIKQNQKRDTVHLTHNDWYLSLLSIDTLNINNILGNETVIKSEDKST